MKNRKKEARDTAKGFDREDIVHNNQHCKTRVESAPHTRFTPSTTYFFPKK
jgi:hypothetical protein